MFLSTILDAYQAQQLTTKFISSQYEISQTRRLKADQHEQLRKLLKTWLYISHLQRVKLTIHIVDHSEFYENDLEVTQNK